MNKDIMRALGFDKEVDRVERGLCPFCGRSIAMEKFRDDASREEHRISGLCQDCQDKTFKEGEEDGEYIIIYRP